MQNLKQALQDITDSLNAVIKKDTPHFKSKTSDDLMFYYNAYTSELIDRSLVEDSTSIALTLSDKGQCVDFVIGMLNKAYSEHNIYQSILFKSYVSALNDFTLVDHRYAQMVVEMCSNRSFNEPNPQLYSILSVIVNYCSDDFQEPLHVSLLEEAKLVCLTKMFLAIQAKKSKFRLAN
ncbi:hypothetical protein ACOLNO_003781 [Vibrio parahaemolyticus]